MANRGRTSRFPRTSGSRRKVTWGVGPRGVVAKSSDGAALFPIAVQQSLDDTTLIRIRGECLLALDTTGAALEGFSRIGIGICNVSSNAAGVGVTAIELPLTDMAWDGWIWHWVGSLFTVGTTPTDANGSAVVRIPIDNKAMRKIHAFDTLVASIETLEEVGTAQMQAVLNTRVLDMLP